MTLDTDIVQAALRRDRRFLVDSAKALKRDPQMLGKALIELEQAQDVEGLALLAKALHRSFLPGLQPALTQIARKCHLKGAMQDALEVYTIALAYSRSATLLHLMGMCHLQMGNRAKARECFRASLAAAPAMAANTYMLAQIDLMESGFTKGFEAYASRLSLDGGSRCDTAIPRWRGEPLAGKSLFLWWEQGAGDIVMFTSVLPYLLAQNPAKITLALRPQLVALYRRSFPDMEILAMDESGDVSIRPHDFAAPVGECLRYSLPHYTPATHPPFLKADAAQVAQMRAGMDQFVPGRKIGISWATTSEMGANIRNIPLPLWEPILRTPGCAFFSLQHGEAEKAQMQAYAQATGLPLIVDAGFDATADLDRLAAITCAMDEVISAQNTVAHLAGALGKPTTLLLPYASDFRWLLGRSDSIWYASVFIERQDAPMDWSGPIARTAAKLKAKEPVALPIKTG